MTHRENQQQADHEGEESASVVYQLVELWDDLRPVDISEADFFISDAYSILAKSGYIADSFIRDSIDTSIDLRLDQDQTSRLVDAVIALRNTVPQGRKDSFYKNIFHVERTRDCQERDVRHKTEAIQRFSQAVFSRMINYQLQKFTHNPLERNHLRRDLFASVMNFYSEAVAHSEVLPLKTIQFIEAMLDDPTLELWQKRDFRKRIDMAAFYEATRDHRANHVQLFPPPEGKLPVDLPLPDVNSTPDPDQVLGVDPIPSPRFLETGVHDTEPDVHSDGVPKADLTIRPFERRPISYPSETPASPSVAERKPERDLTSEAAANRRLGLGLQFALVALQDSRVTNKTISPENKQKIKKILANLAKVDGGSIIAFMKGIIRSNATVAADMLDTIEDSHSELMPESSDYEESTDFLANETERD